MSRFQTVLNHPIPHSQRSKLSVGIFLAPESLAQAILERLDHDRYSVTMPKTSSDFFSVVEHEKQHLDCLILQGGSALAPLAKQLHGQATLLPAVIVSTDIALDTLPTTSGTVKPGMATSDPTVSDTNAMKAADALNAVEASEDTSPVVNLAFVYHTAEIWITIAQCDAISDHIEQAIG
ncbi:MAG TPA: hypothetical protein V6C98_00030, partial [Thermosynechococcaceae cyanobacterium]